MGMVSLQVIWGAVAYRWPRRDVLLFGAAGSLAVVALWIVASGGAYALMVGSLVALLLGAHHHGA